MATRAAGTDVAASIVHQDVDVPKTLDGLAHDARDVLRDRQVPDDAQRFYSVLSPDVSGRLR